MHRPVTKFRLMRSPRRGGLRRRRSEPPGQGSPPTEKWRMKRRKRMRYGGEQALKKKKYRDTVGQQADHSACRLSCCQQRYLTAACFFSFLPDAAPLRGFHRPPSARGPGSGSAPLAAARRRRSGSHRSRCPWRLRRRWKDRESAR